MKVQQANWEFAAEAPSVAQARKLIAQRFFDLPDEVLEVALLLTSELVTNAVLHAAGPVGVQVAWGDGGLRVEVEDQDPEVPVVQALDRDALNGRGLVLVDGLSSGWGVRAVGTGKKVWFTLEA